MIRYMKHRDFRRAHGDVLGIHYTDDNGQHVIDVPYHASTRTRLHELGHKVLDHRADEKMTFDDLLARECDAELFGIERMDRCLDWRVTLPAIYSICEYNAIPENELLNMARGYMERHAIPFNKWDISELWDTIKAECRTIRELKRKGEMDYA